MNQFMKFILGFETLVDSNQVVYINVENELYGNVILSAGLSILILLAHFSYKYIELPASKFRFKAQSAT